MDVFTQDNTMELTYQLILGRTLQTHQLWRNHNTTDDPPTWCPEVEVTNPEVTTTASEAGAAAPPVSYVNRLGATLLHFLPSIHPTPQGTNLRQIDLMVIALLYLVLYIPC